MCHNLSCWMDARLCQWANLTMVNFSLLLLTFWHWPLAIVLISYVKIWVVWSLIVNSFNQNATTFLISIQFNLSKDITVNCFFLFFKLFQCFSIYLLPLCLKHFLYSSFIPFCKLFKVACQYVIKYFGNVISVIHFYSK